MNVNVSNKIVDIRDNRKHQQRDIYLFEFTHKQVFLLS